MNSYFMRDFAGLDARSVKAALQGRGDGRDRCFNNWLEILIRCYPGLSFEACSELASRALLAGLPLSQRGWFNKAPMKSSARATVWSNCTPKSNKNRGDSFGSAIAKPQGACPLQSD